MGAASVCVLYGWMFFVFSLLFPNHCVTINSISRSQPLSQGQSLTSLNQIYELGFFTPAGSSNLYVGIWYYKISPQKVVWVANRKTPLTTDSLATLGIGSNGNLMLIDGNRMSIWSSDIHVSSVKSTSLIAILLDNGNLALQDAISGENLWESFDHPCDTILSGMRIGINTITREKQVLTSWKSDSDPSPGNFVVGITAETPSQSFIWNGKTPYWRGGQWDKSKFIGIANMAQSYLNGYDLQQNVQHGTAYLYVNVYNTSSLRHMVISPAGSLKMIVWNKSEKEWNSLWETPNDQCDVYGVCGPFGVCRDSSSPICRCLKGFVPKSKEEWSRGNWTGGCVRHTTLRCEENSTKKRDVFWKMSGMKLPDFSEYLYLSNQESCQSWCLKNCSCTAYAYVTGIGCMLWTRELVDVQEFPFSGEDLFVRLSYSEIGARKKLELLIIRLVAIAGLIIILATSAYGLCRWRVANQRENRIGIRKHSFFRGITYSSRDSQQEDTWKSHLSQQDQSELPMIDFDDILLATNKFSISNKLGQGGFGPVYKGKLQDGKYIAVKRLSSSSEQGIEEFKNEIISISKLQHRNLVRLIGCCIKREEKLLVYEYMPNKSLDTILFDPSKRSQLDWVRRFDIIQGVARGLLYLHRDSCLRVIHRDLKVSNILLDENMSPKISDFGLARIFHGTQDLANTHRVVGTLGYMSPEYAIGGIFSEKSDVFSFGVLLLEIVSGKKNTGFHHRGEHINLLAYAWELWGESWELDLVDESLGDSFCSAQVKRCIHVGLLCVQDQPADRPSMSAVLPMLCSEIECPKPKQPTLTFKTASASCEYDHHLQSNSSNMHTLNDITVSMAQGR